MPEKEYQVEKNFFNFNGSTFVYHADAGFFIIKL